MSRDASEHLGTFEFNHHLVALCSKPQVQSPKVQSRRRTARRCRAGQPGPQSRNSGGLCPAHRLRPVNLRPRRLGYSRGTMQMESVP